MHLQSISLYAYAPTISDKIHGKKKENQANFDKTRKLLSAFAQV